MYPSFNALLSYRGGVLDFTPFLAGFSWRVTFWRSLGQGSGFNEARLYYLRGVGL
jgi:hypothetical protein